VKVRGGGSYGNAILSRHPILTQSNQDVSDHRFESRGLLHCEIRVAQVARPVHCVCVHLGLTAGSRRRQMAALVARLGELAPDGAPLIIAGDFNDWRHKANRALIEDLGVVEVFEHVSGRTARTFPALMPMFRLDRIYARGLDVIDARVHLSNPGNRMSDHAALAATFDLSMRPR
jgi:endonuclease/exonuclease/phosphatase family metal-dependent hydrolase